MTDIKRKVFGGVDKGHIPDPLCQEAVEVIFELQDRITDLETRECKNRFELEDEEEKAFIAEILKEDQDNFESYCILDVAQELYENLAEDVLNLVELGLRDQDPKIKEYVLEKFQEEFRFWIDE